MTRLWLLLTLPLLAACGLGETATSAATVGAAKKAELEQAQAAQEKVLKDMAQANQQAEDRLKAAEGR